MVLTVCLDGRTRPLLVACVSRKASPSSLAHMIQAAARRAGVSTLALSYKVVAI